MAIYYPDIEQGSAAWHALRAGRPTASNAHRVVTPAKALLSKGREGYADFLVAERMLGRALETYAGEAADRGKELEPQAIAAFEFQTGKSVTRVGFVTTDDGLVGASPDFLVGDSELGEIKCLGAEIHVGRLRRKKVTDEHRCQLQSQLYVTERERVHLVNYFPGLPLSIITVERDEEFISLIAGHLRTFSMEVDEEFAKMESAYGPFTRQPAPSERAADSVGSLGISEQDVEEFLAMQRAERERV